jgi:hypothetical protein
MDKTNYLKRIIPVELIQQMRINAESTLKQVRDDYFPQKTIEDFQKDHIEHAIPSIVSKIITLRFLDLELMSSLKEYVEGQISEIYNKSEPSSLLIHPGFYLRFSWPNKLYAEKQTEPLLDSAPHYDVTFGLPAYTFWIPLVEINDDTGGLCYFKGDKIFELFPRSFNKNKYNYETYLKIAPTIDKKLKEGIVRHEIELGDALTWDSTLLHGATRPKTSVRMSIDFRLVNPSELKKCSKIVQKTFDEVNKDFDITRAQNLMIIGDFLGAARILEVISEKTKNSFMNKMAATMKACRPYPEILKKGTNFYWQDEYKWIVEDY